MPTKLVRVVILGERDWGWEKGRLKFYFLFELFYQESGHFSSTTCDIGQGA